MTFVAGDDVRPSPAAHRPASDHVDRRGPAPTAACGRVGRRDAASECRRGVLPCGFRVRSRVAESADCARAGLYLTAVRPTAFLAAQSYVVALVCSRILVPTLDIIFLPTLRTAKDRVDSRFVAPCDVQI